MIDFDTIVRTAGAIDQAIASFDLVGEEHDPSDFNLGVLEGVKVGVKALRSDLTVDELINEEAVPPAFSREMTRSLAYTKGLFAGAVALNVVLRGGDE